jgi:hypothetical protein
MLVSFSALAQVQERAAILEHMKRLEPLVGAWSAVAMFHDPETPCDGTYLVQPVLGGTYLQFEVEWRRRSDHSRRSAFFIFVTWDPRAGKYVSTYFYTGSSLRVTETGELDEAAREFRTTAFVPLEDGVRDENVRTALSLKDPSRLVYEHYSRYGNEPRERNDLTVTLTRLAGF